MSAKGLRTITFTSSPPMRREVRQQSIAVLPPPSTMTRLPIVLMCSKATLDSQSSPMWILASVSLRPGSLARSRPRGAPLPTNTASKPLCQQAFQAVDVGVEMGVDAHAEHIPDLFIQHRFRQAERGDCAAHEAAALGATVKEVDLIPQRGQIARHRQRGGPRADQGDLLAVAGARLGQPRGDIALEVGGDPLQPADGDRFFLDPDPAAGRLAGAVAGAAQNAGEHVAFPVDQIGVGIALVGDQANILGHRRMRRAGILAVDNLMKILRVSGIRRIQNRLHCNKSRSTCRQLSFILSNCKGRE